MNKNHDNHNAIEGNRLKYFISLISPEMADRLFALSNGVLIFGAAAVLVGTIGAILMSGVRERFADERISANEAATARAIADTEKARGEAAEANQKTVEIAKQAADLGVTVDTLNDFVKQKTTEADTAVRTLNAMTAEAQAKIAAIQKAQAPRTISAEQQHKIIEILGHFPGVAVDVWLCHATTADAAPLAETILNILRLAKWQARGVSSLMGRPGEGVVVAVRPNPSQNDNVAAMTLLKELNAAGIFATLQVGVTDQPVNVLGAFVGVGGEQPSSNLWVVVGSKI